MILQRKKSIQRRSLHHFDYIWFRVMVICQLFSGYNSLYTGKQRHSCLPVDSLLDHRAVWPTGAFDKVHDRTLSSASDPVWI